MDAPKHNATVQGGEVAGSHADAKSTDGDYTPSFGDAVKPDAAPLKIAFVDSQASPVRELKTMPWGELSAMLSAPAVSSTKSGTAWIPADIEPGARTGDRVQSVSCLVLDVEAATSNDRQTKTKTVTGTEPPPFAEIVTELCIAGFAFILHTSYSHHDPAILPVDIQHPRYRIIFALSRPLAKDEVRPLALHVAGMFGLSDCVDTSCMEPARLYFMPRVPAERLDQYQHAHIEGAPLDVDALLNDARREADALAHISRGTMAQRDSVIDAFNEAHSPGAILENHGYVPHRNRWMHPNSTSGLPGVRLLPDSNPERVYSSHSNDPLNNGHAHDAFDCYRILVHGGDFKTAVKTAAYLLGMNGATRANPATIFAGGVPPPPPAAGVAATGGAVSLQGIEMSLLQLGTQDSVAQIFARQMDGKMLYNHARRKWLEWDGTRWQIEAMEKALNFARDLARSVNYEGSRSMGSASFCAGVEQLAKADPVLSVKGTEFDRDNYLLNTPGGTFDLRTNTLRPHNPVDHISMRTAVTPSPEGGAVFDKFLGEITMGDRELSEYLQVSLGACLSGAVESHWMLFWIGGGRNGKNTLGDLVQDAMGDYARKVPTSTLMAKTHEGHPTEIANLFGVRLALSSEINDGEHWHEARINEVTGDSTLSARFMKNDFFTFQRTHKHLIYGNHRPQLRGVGSAITSRIKIVPFKASFLGREDGDLPRRLRENLGFVLAWLIEGHSKWLAAGKRLPPCQAVEAESADYFAAQSTPEMWLAERVQILAPDARPASQCHKSSDLYRDYANWKKDRGENPMSQTRWAETMQKKFQKEASNGVRYRGLMLIPQVGNAPFPLSPNAQPSYAN